MTAAIAVGILAAGGIFLVLQKGLVRVTLGFILLGHAANLVLVASGGMARRGVPIIGWTAPEEAADPLPQAFALTAIVITFGITVYLLGLARAGADDLTEGSGPDGDVPRPGDGTVADRVPDDDDGDDNRHAPRRRPER